MRAFIAYFSPSQVYAPKAAAHRRDSIPITIFLPRHTLVSPQLSEADILGGQYNTARPPQSHLINGKLYDGVTDRRAVNRLRRFVCESVDSAILPPKRRKILAPMATDERLFHLKIHGEAMDERS